MVAFKFICLWKFQDPGKRNTVVLYIGRYANTIIFKPQVIFNNSANIFMSVQLQKKKKKNTVILIKRELPEIIICLGHFFLVCVSFTLYEDITLAFPCYVCLVEFSAF